MDLVSTSQHIQSKVSCFVLIIVGSIFSCSSALGAQDYEGFLEPFRKIELACDESGAIMNLLVEEGQHVDVLQPIAVLENRVQQIQLEISRVAAESLGQKIAAEEGYQKRVQISQKLNQLRQQGHASESEIARADMELSIAKARLQTTIEELLLRELELQRAEIQLKRRTIMAPFAGVIAKVYAREGEYISPLRPEIVSLIQSNKLIAKINVPNSKVSSFQVGQTWMLQVSETKRVQARIQSIGVEVDAESETVEVRLVVENQNFELRSGERITLSI